MYCVTGEHIMGRRYYRCPILTCEQFADWLQSRRKQHESYESIGDSLASSHVAVHHWIAGIRRPSRQVRALAALLARTSQVIDE